MLRIGIAGLFHETNSFALEQNDRPTARVARGEEILANAHPRSYVGGFLDGIRRKDIELVPTADVNFSDRGGTIHPRVFEHYRDMIVAGLRDGRPLHGIYLALHGAAAAGAPYEDPEGSLIRAVREVVGDRLPIVATYDFHGNYTEDKVRGAVPFPLNTNPHIDAYERGIEAAQCLLHMIAGAVRPVSRIVRVPIVGPNIGQSTWSHIPPEEQQLPLFQLNLRREEIERSTPGLLNVTIQGGYGYSDVPYVGMSVIATADGDEAVAERAATQLAADLWVRRDQIRTVRPQIPIDEGVRRAMAIDDGLVCLVDLGDDPQSSCPADAPVVLESLLRLGARDAALTIRDVNVIKAAMQAGVGATLTMDVGASVDRRFYEPIKVTGTVRSIDDGNYMAVGPMHGSWGREVRREAFREFNVGPRVVLRLPNKIDVIFSERTTGKDRDFFKSAGIVLEEKRIIVVKSNQAHRASFDPIVAATFNLDTPGVSTVNYAGLPYKRLPRPMFPMDPEMRWSV